RALTGLLGHAPGLYHDLTAAENLRFALRMHGEAADAGVIARALDEVGLASDGDTRVRGFSAGMQRRLALARLIVKPPRLLLLDEPFASLDADGIDRIKSFIARQRSAGATTIVATHDPDRAAHLIDRLVRLDRGRISEGTTTAEKHGGDAYTGVDTEREWSA
ncbi:MAG TPA: ATP-binding cassette domain-containing protein, partial [Gemmatimonadaceae bacterium]|nr:ATP-binding cassette domain-containing protein [Gemmatimonadaceae bacterium]